VDEDVRVDCLWAGVESMDAIMREVSAVASGCETKINNNKRVGTRTTCCYGFLVSLGTYRSYCALLCEQRRRQLLVVSIFIVYLHGETDTCTGNPLLINPRTNCNDYTHLFSSSLRPSSGHEANMLRVRFALLRNSGSSGGRAVTEVMVTLKVV
jgi:hypothetical protein